MKNKVTYAEFLKSRSRLYKITMGRKLGNGKSRGFQYMDVTWLCSRQATKLAQPPRAPLEEGSWSLLQTAGKRGWNTETLLTWD